MRRRKNKRIASKELSPLLVRIIMMSLIYLSIQGITLLNRNSIFSYESVKNEINQHMNIGKIAKISQGKLNIFKDEAVEVSFDKSNVDDYEVLDNGLKIKNIFEETVLSVSEGIVVKVSNELIFIKGIDGYDYVYKNIYENNVKIYQYIKINDILGLAKYNQENEKFEYVLEIKEKDSFLDVKVVIGID